MHKSSKAAAHIGSLFEFHLSLIAAFYLSLSLSLSHTHTHTHTYKHTHIRTEKETEKEILTHKRKQPLAKERTFLHTYRGCLKKKNKKKRNRQLQKIILEYLFIT